MKQNFNLPLDLSKNTSLKTFLIALDDKAVYKELVKKKTNLPIVASEILDMLNDEHFKSSTKSLSKKYSQIKKGESSSIDSIKKEGKDFHDYLLKKYPNGYKRLQDFGNTIISPKDRIFETDVATDTAVAVQSVVSAAVWANVAAVTNVAVAAEAVAVVGVFVV
jgi:hypothetical protein